MTTKNIKEATDELLHELQKGEDSAKEKGYIDISDVEKILKANQICNRHSLGWRFTFTL